MTKNSTTLSERAPSDGILTPEKVLAGFADAYTPVMVWEDGIVFDHTHPNWNSDRNLEACRDYRLLPNKVEILHEHLNQTTPANMANIHNWFTGTGVRQYVFNGKLDFGLNKNINWEKITSIYKFYMPILENDADKMTAYCDYVLSIQDTKI